MRVLTFDIEDWFHILDHEQTRRPESWDHFESRVRESVDSILQFLHEENLRATFFCLGWIARRHPAVLRAIASAGHEIGCHSDTHQLVYEQDRISFRADLSSALSSISDVIGTGVTLYRAPGFSVGPLEAEWFFDEIALAGIAIDCSIFPAKRAHGGFAKFGPAKPTNVITKSGASVKEFPMSVFELLGKRLVYSGGGYFRILPFPFISAMARRQQYVMTYFHPRDFDVGQPVLHHLSAIRRFKSYCGISTALEKLRRLSRDVEFCDLSTASSRVDWDCAPRITF